MPEALATLKSSTLTLVEAARRVASLAVVDAALAVPSSKPLWDVALTALAPTPSNGSKFVFYRPSKRPAALLVLCHPSEGPSMCRSLADAWESGLREVGVEVQRIDLEAGRQWGLNGPEELKAALTGRDPTRCVSHDVSGLQDAVEQCQFLIFVHPIFWFDVPSQLKGFQESVLSSGFAFRKLPEHWLLNRAAGVVEGVPIARTLMRRYASYGLLRDKYVFVTRTQGGPAAGLGIFGHGATSLESSLQFCGAHLASVDAIAELDGTSEADLRERVFPSAVSTIQAHCRKIAKMASAASAGAAPLEKEGTAGPSPARAVLPRAASAIQTRCSDVDELAATMVAPPEKGLAAVVVVPPETTGVEDVPPQAVAV